MSRKHKRKGNRKIDNEYGIFPLLFYAFLGIIFCIINIVSIIMGGF